MEVFQAVALAGSLASAARRLNVSPATIIRTVASLEARLNTTLLSRSPRGISLNPEGEQFAMSCHYILQEITDAERSVAGLHTLAAGKLTVSLPLLMTHQVFMPVALAYLEAFPEMQIVSLSRENVPKLLVEGIDIAFVVGHLPDSSGFAVPIGTVKTVVCGSPEYFAKWGRPATPCQMSRHRTLLTTPTDHVADGRGPSAASTRQAPLLTCTTRQAAIRAAVLGMGLIRCMNVEVYEELQSGVLEPAFDDLITPALPVQLIYREGRKATARVRTFIDFAVPLLRIHPAFRD
jgi:DNA-binding transcriptional LysR family regulator